LIKYLIQITKLIANNHAVDAVNKTKVINSFV